MPNMVQLFFSFLSVNFILKCAKSRPIVCHENNEHYFNEIPNAVNTVLWKLQKIVVFTSWQIIITIIINNNFYIIISGK